MLFIMKTLWRICNKTLKKYILNKVKADKEEKVNFCDYDIMTQSSSDRLTISKKLPLDSLICHFNWDICNITPATLQARILSAEEHVKENSCGILPQSYCLLAFLKSKLVPLKKCKFHVKIR